MRIHCHLCVFAFLFLSRQNIFDSGMGRKEKALFLSVGIIMQKQRCLLFIFIESAFLIAIYKETSVSHRCKTNKCQKNSGEKLIMLKSDEFPDKRKFRSRALDETLLKA